MVLARRLRTALLVILIGLAIFAGLDRLFPLALPTQDGSRFAKVVVDAKGNPLRAFADSNGVWQYQVSIDEVSPLYIEALLNYEDRWFWSHPGVNPLSIVRAAWQNAVNGRIVSGGSTITMQVARLLHPHKRSIGGKLQQLFRTFQLEWQLSKQEILTLYLNLAPFGGTIEGVQAASFTYLEKSAKALSHAEAALLTVLPQAPTRFRPDRNADAAQQARDKVLDRMQRLGVWSKQTVTDAKLESVYAFAAKHKQIAPLFARRMLSQNPKASVIRTTIDGDMQTAIEAYVKDYAERMPRGASAAVLVVDNESGAVKAYLGSADFADNARFGHVDMVRAKRSVGSTLKPFLFAMAMDKGLIHSHSLLMDVPRATGMYRPANFTKGFSGPVTAKGALQRSLNVPFVDLLERMGPADFVDRLSGAGVQLAIPGGKANLAVILGGVGSSLEHLVTGYSALAGSGKTLKLKFLADDVQVKRGQRYLLSEQSSWITHKVLSEITRPGSLSSFAMTSAQPLAWKTGTSFGHRDTWAIGVSLQYTIGVWLGRPDGTPIPGHTGRDTAGPLLFAVSDYVHSDLQLPKQPENVTRVDICWPLGLPTQDKKLCHQKHQAWVIDDTVMPTWFGEDVWQTNPMPYWVSSTTKLRVDAQCSAQSREQKWLALWPRALEPWLPRQYTLAGQLPRLDSSCRQTVPVQDNSLRIAGLQQGNIYRTGGNSKTAPTVVLKALGGSGRQHWYINGKLAHANVGPSGINHQFKTPGAKQLLVIDEAGNIDKTEVFAQF